jgi:prolipoprotein diacylglyceryltransferase
VNLIGIALIVSVAVALYNLQQIKITLKEKGFAIEILTGWLSDYRRFKELIRHESNQQNKIRYQKIINGLHFSLAGVVFLLFLVLRDRAS